MNEEAEQQSTYTDDEPIQKIFHHYKSYKTNYGVRLKVIC
jgi:hypothetical protein